MAAKPCSDGIERQAEKRRARNSRNAVWAAGQVLPIEQDEADDLAEAERHNGQIVAAQAQHRKAKQDSGERRQNAGKWQADPERQAEILGDQRVGIGADRIEGDVAEIEEAGEADDDVQPEAEHRIGEDQNAEIEQIAVVVEDDRNDQRKADETPRAA